MKRRLRSPTMKSDTKRERVHMGKHLVMHVVVAQALSVTSRMTTLAVVGSGNVLQAGDGSVSDVRGSVCGCEDSRVIEEAPWRQLADGGEEDRELHLDQTG
ncbi:hypothetical protein PAMA_018076 [Pampus argenteus]